MIDHRDELLARLPADQAKLMRRYWDLNPDQRTEALDDIAERVMRFGRFASDRQAAFFGVRLRAAAAGQSVASRESVPEPPVVPPSVDDFPW